MIEAGRAWVRGHRRLLVALAALLILYALAGFLLVPRLARDAIQSYVRNELGRHVAIASLRFNPFSLTADFRGVALTEADGAAIAGLDRLVINAELSSIFHRAWTFKEIRIDNPSLSAVVNEDGSLNLDRIRPIAPEGTPARAGPSAIPALRIALFAVRGGRVHFEDRSRGKPFAATLQPLEFTLQDFRTAPRFENSYQFEGTTLAGERLAWAGEFTVQPLGSSGRFSINGLRAATIAAYLQDALPFGMPSGALDVQGEYRASLGASLGLSVQLPIVQLRELSIMPKQGDAANPWIRVPELRFTDTRMRLGERTLSVGKLEAVGAQLAVWREPDGQLNLQKLFPARAPVPEPTHPVASSQAGVTAAASGAEPAHWTVSVASAQLRDVAVHAEDRTTNPAVVATLAPIAVTVSGYSTAPGSKLTVDASIGMAQASLGARGQLSVEPLSADLNLGLKDFDLNVLQPYVAQHADLQVRRGRLTAQARLVLAAAPARRQPRLKLGGDFEVADLLTRDGLLQNDFITWQSLRVSGFAYQQAPDRLSIERVVARQPYARVIISADGKLNVAAVLRSRQEAVGSRSTTASAPGVARPAPATTAPMPMRIGTVLIEDGTADFADHSIQPNFAAQMQTLNGRVVGLSSDPQSRAQVSLNGSVDRYAPVSVSGQVNVLSASAYTDLAIAFRNMELTTFNPYSGKFAGYSITQGKLTTELHYHVENRKLEAQHHVVLDQLEFGAATESKQAVPLPVKLAAALLKDRNGVIDINLPVSGSLDDPNFRVGPIVWKLFVGLLRKIVTAPFALLGSLFGGGAELAFVDFAPASAMLAPQQTQKLAQLSKALAERPQLKLDIPLHTGSVEDDAAIARGALEQAINARLPAAPAGARGTPRAGPGAATVSPRTRALAELYQATFGAPPAYPPPEPTESDLDAAHAAWLVQQLLPKFAASQAQRDALERGRAEAVQAAVMGNATVAAERIFLTERASGAGPPGAVRMDLKLQ
ncbi:MAG TPA: DUF748 domain-containing protein [Steroidobacteraceae bacterium]